MHSIFFLSIICKQPSDLTIHLTLSDGVSCFFIHIYIYTHTHTYNRVPFSIHRCFLLTFLLLFHHDQGIFSLKVIFNSITNFLKSRGDFEHAKLRVHLSSKYRLGRYDNREIEINKMRIELIFWQLRSSLFQRLIRIEMYSSRITWNQLTNQCEPIQLTEVWSIHREETRSHFTEGDYARVKTSVFLK